jgi:hypothetical protein
MKSLEDTTYAMLAEAAEVLASRRAIPIEIGELCRELGVAIRRAPVGRARALLVDAKKNPKILLPARDHLSDNYSPWERFLIAHELGHLVLHRKNVPKPLSPSEYWRTESCCDAFARWLLIPEAQFGKFGKRAANTAAQRLNFTRYLETTAAVNWAAAAMRVADWHSDVAFLHLRPEDECTLKVYFSSTRKELHRRISTKEPLVQVLRHCARGPLETISPTLLGCFPSLAGASSSVASCGSEDFRLAIIFATADKTIRDGRRRAA